jgi:hypothetical protein
VSNIRKRLQRVTEYGLENYDMTVGLIIEAEAEIGRLEAALHEIISLRGEDMYHATENSMAAAIAKAALEPKP